MNGMLLGGHFAFLCNVLDTVVLGTTAHGTAIGASLWQAWASALYGRYGFVAAVNGAIAAWVTVAGEGA